MKRIFAALLLTATPALALMHMECVIVGDTQPVARYWVPRPYRIGKYEVTNIQYAGFLNAVAATADPYGLHDPLMATDPRGGITKTTTGGITTYTVRADMAQKPVNFVGVLDAARFCNWLHHGQPSGPGAAAHIEDGAYRMNGLAALARQPRRSGARFALPTADEWRKAAYFDPGAPAAASYLWLYPSQSNTTPVKAAATATGFCANQGANVVNYGSGAVWGGQTGHLLQVGSCGSFSYFGTADQAGNVREITETDDAGDRLCLGGDFSSATGNLSAAAPGFISDTSAEADPYRVGFRIVQPLLTIEPEMVEIGSPGNAADPSTGSGAVSGRYRMGRYEVLNEEWIAFLNAQDRDGTAGLWNTSMESTPQGGITRTGAAGSYLYWVKPGYSRMPVTHVSAIMAMRFCNWMHHGQPVAGEDPESITANGAYNATSATNAPARLSGARYFLPTVNEWAKAARYNPGQSNYWAYATQSITAPAATPCDARGHLLPTPGTPAANYGGAANWNGSNAGNVTAAGSAGPDSLSPWGCADMAGNASELCQGTGGTSAFVIPGSYSQPLGVLNTVGSISASEASVGFRLAARSLPVTLETVSVSSPDTGDFRIGKFEITNRQWAVFLNSIGALNSDAADLFDQRMADLTRGGIQKVTINVGGGTVTTFSPKANMGDKPVNFITWFDAARFCNWLHHGQPIGGLEVYTRLDSGAYNLNPAIPNDEKLFGPESNARWRLPSEAEWRTAAFTAPDGTTYTYPTGSNTAPTPALATSTGGVSNPGPSVANYNTAADWAGLNGHLTDVGACGSLSPRGCADMAGNVLEHIGPIFKTGTNRVSKRIGGGWDSTLGQISSTGSTTSAPDAFADSTSGFRIAAPSVPLAIIPPGPAGEEVRITDFVRVTPGLAALTHTTRAGFIYSLQASSDLSAWTTLQNGVVGTGQPKVFEILITPGTQPRTFYRVVEAPSN